MDRPDIEKILKLEQAATPGEWKFDLDFFGEDDEEIEACVSDETISILIKDGTGFKPENKESWKKAAGSQAYKNAEFIASARTDIPELVKYIEQLEEENEYKYKENYIELLEAYMDLLEEELTDKSEFLKATMATLISERAEKKLKGKVPLYDSCQVPSHMSKREEAEFWSSHEMTKEFLDKVNPACIDDPPE